jgi:putative pyoverdin transport system ATP-binding/permease protein
MRLIGMLAHRSWRLLLISGVASLLAGLSYAAIVTIIGQGILPDAPLPSLGLTLIGIGLIHLLMRCVSMKTMLDLSQGALNRLRLDLSRRIIATPQETLQRLGKHRLLAILTQDVDRLSEAYQIIAGLFSNVVTIIACLLYIGWLYPPLLAFVAGSLMLGIGAIHSLKRMPMRDLEEAREQLDCLYRYLRNLIDGSRELQLNSRRGRAYVDEVIAPSAAHIRNSMARGLLRYSLVANIGLLIFFGAIGVVLFVLPYWLHFPSGALAGSVITILFMAPSITELLLALPTVGRARVALEKIDQLEGVLPEAAMLSVAPLAGGEVLQLELRGIRHRYGDQEDRKFELGPLDLCINAGEIVFVIGGNGSGKSTLAMLMLGLYRAEAGQILLNGRLLEEGNREQYRQHFSAVLADFHLFEEVSDANDPHLAERAAVYLRALNIAHKVRIDEGRFSTLELSSGQRRRLALVIAYLEDRPIYLFDEWAADQDPEFKRLFYTHLLPELKAAGKAVIVITHDDAYFEYADRLVRLDEGRLKSDLQLRKVAS